MQVDLENRNNRYLVCFSYMQGLDIVVVHADINNTIILYIFISLICNNRIILFDHFVLKEYREACV